MSDHMLGRMTCPVSTSSLDMDSCNIAQRFSVEQGVKQDGSLKVRPCDDMTGSGINGCTQPCEKLRNDSANALVVCIRLLASLSKSAPVLWKADMDAAYRRIPIRPGDRWAAWVAFCVGDKMWSACHLSIMFGASSSVHAWNRIGALLCHLGGSLLRLPLLRYVDDFFAPDLPACARRSMLCFARVVRAIMECTSISDRKLDFGNPLVVLD